MKDNDVHTLGDTVTEKLMAHTTTFPNPPVDPKTLKTDNDNFGAGIVAAQDGGKTAIAQKDMLRQIVIRDLRLIGRYVEETANGDASIFALSGLRPISGTRTPQDPLSPHFRNIKHGKLTGQIVIQFKAVPGALSYELHSAAMSNGMPAMDKPARYECENTGDVERLDAGNAVRVSGPCHGQSGIFRLERCHHVYVHVAAIATDLAGSDSKPEVPFQDLRHFLLPSLVLPIVKRLP